MMKKFNKIAIVLYIIAFLASGYWFATSQNTPEMKQFAQFIEKNFQTIIIGGIIGFVFFIQFKPAFFKMIALHCLTIEITLAYVLGAQLFVQYKAEMLNWIVESFDHNAWYYSLLYNTYPFIVQSYPVWLPIMAAIILRLIIRITTKVYKKGKEKDKQREIKNLTGFHDRLSVYQMNPLHFLELISESNSKDDFSKAVHKFKVFTEELESRCVDSTERAKKLGLNLKYNVHER